MYMYCLVLFEYNSLKWWMIDAMSFLSIICVCVSLCIYYITSVILDKVNNRVLCSLISNASLNAQMNSTFRQYHTLFVSRVPEMCLMHLEEWRQHKWHPVNLEWKSILSFYFSRTCTYIYLCTSLVLLGGKVLWGWRNSRVRFQVSRLVFY